MLEEMEAMAAECSSSERTKYLLMLDSEAELEAAMESASLVPTATENAAAATATMTDAEDISPPA
jgi:hypothetical protein